MPKEKLEVVDSTKRNKFCIEIYVDKSEEPTFINFDSFEQKKDYVLGEDKFCRGELKNYASAMDKKSRKEARNELEKKRTKFAKMNGFGPNKNQKGRVVGKRYWFLQEKEENIVA